MPGKFSEVEICNFDALLVCWCIAKAVANVLCRTTHRRGIWKNKIMKVCNRGANLRAMKQKPITSFNEGPMQPHNLTPFPESPQQGHVPPPPPIVTAVGGPAQGHVPAPPPFVTAVGGPAGPPQGTVPAPPPIVTAVGGPAGPIPKV